MFRLQKGSKGISSIKIITDKCLTRITDPDSPISIKL
jgi:hypothetical protein